MDHLQEEWREARGDGEEWAGLMVGEMANEAALDYLVWKFEEGEIEEGKAEEVLRELMEERWKIDNGITEREMAMATREEDHDLAGELAEELKWRKENPRKAVDEMIAEFLGELEEPGEAGEVDIEGEIYTPPPVDREDMEDELKGVSFQYDAHAVSYTHLTLPTKA